MICETCRWSGRPGFVRAPRERSQRSEYDGFVPCPDCGGQGIAHCCDGLCEQAQPGPLNDAAT